MIWYNSETTVEDILGLWVYFFITRVQTYKTQFLIGLMQGMKHQSKNKLENSNKLNLGQG